MLVHLAGMLLNIPLNYALINGRWIFPEMGIAGAGLGTAVSWGAMALLFTGLVFLLGIGSGTSASGTLTLMVDFTTVELAGLLMGVWTIAHQLAEVVGNILGGVLVDGVFAMSQSYHAAFSTVFALEIIAAMVALALLSRISVSAFLGSEWPDIKKGVTVAA